MKNNMVKIEIVVLPGTTVVQILNEITGVVLAEGHCAGTGEKVIPHAAARALQELRKLADHAEAQLKESGILP